MKSRQWWGWLCALHAASTALVSGSPLNGRLFAQLRSTDRYEVNGEHSRLKEDLINAEHKQSQLRHRLSEISDVAHQGLMELHEALQDAKASATRSLNALHSEIQSSQSSTAQMRVELASEKRTLSAAMTRLSSQERSVTSLRSRLAAAEKVSAMMAVKGRTDSRLHSQVAASEHVVAGLRTKVTQAEKMAAELALAERAVNTLRQQTAAAKASEVHERDAAAHSVQAWTLRLQHTNAAATAERSAAEKAQTQLQHRIAEEVKEAARHEVSETAMQSQLRVNLIALAKENGRLSTDINSTQDQEAALNSTLGIVRHHVLKLRGDVSTQNSSNAKLAKLLSSQTGLVQQMISNVTMVNLTAVQAEMVSHKQRGLLQDHVSALQKKATNEEEAASFADKHLVEVSHHSAESLQEQKDRVQQMMQVHKREETAMQERLRNALKELNLTQGAELRIKQNASVLFTNLSKTSAKLSAALLQMKGLARAKSQQQANLELLRRNASDSQAALVQMEDQGTFADRSLNTAKAQMNAQLAATSRMRTMVASLQSQLVRAKSELSAQHQKSQKELQAVQADAAAQIRSLTRANQTLRAKITKAYAEEEDSMNDAAKAKDTLVQETNLAIQSSQRTDELGQNLQDAERFTDGNSTKLNNIQGELDELRAERNRAAALLQQRRQDNAVWKARVLGLQNTSKATSTRLQKALAENHQLQSQLQDLGSESDRASQLSDMIASIHASSKQNSSRRAAMFHELTDLRELKDRYSSEYEAWRNESDTWHTRAMELEWKLKLEDKRLKQAMHMRDAAEDKAKEAASHDDEYIQEDSRLQQSNDELRQQISRVGAQANHSHDEEMLAQRRYDELKAAEKKKQDAYNAAWMKNEHELIQSRHDNKQAHALLKNLKSDLSHTRSALTDKQRQAIGFSGKSSKGQAAPAAAPAQSALLEAVSVTNPPVLELEPASTDALTSTMPASVALPSMESAATAIVPAAKFRRAIEIRGHVAPHTKSGSILQDLTAYFASPLPSA